MATLDKTVKELKAAGEATRLRLLVLLSLGELSVKDITQVLDQSQPRISRHLKILMDCSLVVRHAEGAWAYFGINRSSEQAQYVYSLVSRLDLSDRQLSQDRQKLRNLQKEKRERAEKYFAKIANKWDEIRSMHISEHKVETAILSLIGKNKYEFLLDLGTGTARMLELLRDNYKTAVGIDLSKDMVAIARAKLASSNITNAQVRLADIECLDEYFASSDMVILHQVLHYFDDPSHLLFSVSNALTNNGEMLIVDYAPHDFETLRDVHAHQRMGISDKQMNLWARAVGLAVTDYIKIPNNKQKDGLSVCLWLLKNDK